MNGYLALKEDGGGWFFSVNGVTDVSECDWTDDALATDFVEWVEPMCFEATLDGETLDAQKKVDVGALVGVLRQKSDADVLASLLTEHYPDYVQGACKECKGVLPNSHSDVCGSCFHEWLNEGGVEEMPEPEPTAEEIAEEEARLEDEANEFAFARRSEE